MWKMDCSHFTTCLNKYFFGITSAISVKRGLVFTSELVIWGVSFFLAANWEKEKCFCLTWFFVYLLVTVIDFSKVWSFHLTLMVIVDPLYVFMYVHYVGLGFCWCTTFRVWQNWILEFLLCAFLRLINNFFNCA